ncbi:MAG: PAS domain S-box protein, partial [Gemmatimonadetes bacterium]|nr:PAS domain S-box protein [Gemmatimonadota bacterium]
MRSPVAPPRRLDVRVITLAVALGAMGLAWVGIGAVGAFVLHRDPLRDLFFLDMSSPGGYIPLVVVGLALAMTLALSVHFARGIARRESLALIKELKDSLPAAVFETDLDLNVLYANRRALEMFGLAECDLRTGLNALAMLVPEDRERAARVLAVRRGGADPGAQEYTATRADGSTCTVRLRVAPLSRGGRLEGLQGVVLDVSGQKESAAQVRVGAKRFRSIVEASPLGMHFYRLADDGRLVFNGANAAAVKMLGVDHSGFVGKSIEEAFPGLVDTEVPARYRDVATTGAEWSTEQITYDHGGISGAFHVVAFQISPGEMAATFRDITADKQAEKALKDSESRFRTVIEQSNDAIYIVWGERLDFVNRRFCEMAEVTPEEACAAGFTIWDLTAPESREMIRERQRKRARGEPIPSIYEFEMLSRGGKRLQVETSVREIDYRGGKGILGILRDVSEQRALEAQLAQTQRMESIGRLSGGVAHDLNNLLLPVIGHGELLRDEIPAGDPRREALDEIVLAGTRARDLVRQLLAFGGRQTLQLKPLDLAEVVSDFSTLLRRTVREDIRIVLDPAPRGTVVLGDRVQIEQVLLNLVVNAEDAMPEGGTLTIGISPAILCEGFSASHPDLRRGPYVLLSITDTGTGMDAKVQAKAFEPFFTTKKRGAGTGLGLATVHGIVKQHGGAITLHSQ